MLDAALRTADFTEAHDHLARAQRLCRTREYETRHAEAAARLHEAEGEIAQAIDAITRAMQTGGKTPRRLNRLAELYQLALQFDAAKATREEARSLK